MRLRLAHIPRPEAYAAMASLGVSVLLLTIKFTAYFLTGSASIFSDALESVVNVVASAFAIYSLSLAHEPADANHPYGHGKVEFLSAWFEGGMMLLAGAVIFARAIESLISGPQIQRVELGLWLILIAGAINGVVGLYLKRVGRKRSSAALEADGTHLLSDAITSAAVIVALVLVKISGWTYADPIVAMLVGIYVASIAFGLLRASSAGLMDQQDEADEVLLRKILDAHLAPDGKLPHICSYHKLRHRHSGRYHWVDFHIMIPADCTVDEGHKIASAIEYEIEQALREGNATAHVEPCEDAACKACVSHSPEDLSAR